MRIMYKCIYIIVDNQGVVYKSNESAGITGENIQGRINIRFREISQTVEGIAYLEYKRYNPDIKEYEKGLIKMDSTKDDEGKIIMYSIPILSSLLKYTGNIEFQLRITENEIDNYIPVYKSQVFNLSVLEAINAEAEIPEEYPTWLDTANEKIQEIDNINISSKEITDGVEIDITNKEGVTTTNKIYNGKKGDKGDTGARGEQGIPGENGKDGYVQYQAGDNIKIENNVISADIENIPEVYVDGLFPGGQRNITDTVFLGKLEALINKYKDKLYTIKRIACYVDYVSSDVNPYYMSFSCPSTIRNTKTTYYFRGDVQVLTVFNDIRQVITSQVIVNGNWTNDMYHITSCYIIGVPSGTLILSANNTTRYIPTENYNPSTKLYTDKTHYENMTGYDATKTQVLKNVNGVLTWVTEE